MQKPDSIEASSKGEGLARLALIQELQTDEFWQDITLPMLENVRRKLRSLVQFLDPEGKRENVYTNFEDELGQAKTVDGLVKRDARTAR